jgi:hypothetical protein
MYLFKAHATRISLFIEVFMRCQSVVQSTLVQTVLESHLIKSIHMGFQRLHRYYDYL